MSRTTRAQTVTHTRADTHLTIACDREIASVTSPPCSALQKPAGGAIAKMTDQTVSDSKRRCPVHYHLSALSPLRNLTPIFFYSVTRSWRSIHERSCDSFPTYASRTISIPHRLLFTKDGAPTTGVNMRVNLRRTCLCRTTVIAGHFIDYYQL